jgi:hypothetical protein
VQEEKNWQGVYICWIGNGHEASDVYNADETGLFFNTLPDRTLAYKLATEENIPKTDSLCYCVLIVMEVTNKCQLW